MRNGPLKFLSPVIGFCLGAGYFSILSPPLEVGHACSLGCALAPLQQRMAAVEESVAETERHHAAWIATQSCVEDVLGPRAYPNFGTADDPQQPEMLESFYVAKGQYRFRGWVEYLDEDMLRNRSEFTASVKSVGEDIWACDDAPAFGDVYEGEEP